MTKYTLLTDINRSKTTKFPAKNVPMFFLFVIGVAVGVSFALMYTQYQIIVTNQSHPLHFDQFDHLNVIGDDSEAPLHSTTENLTIKANQLPEHQHTHENNTLATYLYEKVRVLCWILTTPSNHQTRAIHVKRTWGKRCNKLLFMSTQHDTSIDSIALNVSVDDKNALWGKTKRAFQYIYDNHRNDADWFLKADDDTYVILENLRYFLHAYSTNDPIYFGYKMNRPNDIKSGYFSGGAGYVLSKNALDRFSDAMRHHVNNHNCRLKTDYGAEDLEMGKCMESLGVLAGDTRDELKRGRFFLNQPEAHLIPGKFDASYWYWQYMWYKSDEGLDCCSDNAISFHYIRPETMYVFDYLIYHLRPYGMVAYPQPLPKKVNFTEIAAQIADEKPQVPSIQSTLPD